MDKQIDKDLQKKVLHDLDKTGARVFDRKSGTGRGKEISKGGAGGKHTWGMNPEVIAKEYVKHVDVKELENQGNLYNLHYIIIRL
jgi:hypothetical protein